MNTCLVPSSEGTCIHCASFKDEKSLAYIKDNNKIMKIFLIFLILYKSRFYMKACILHSLKYYFYCGNYSCNLNFLFCNISFLF